MEGNFLAYYDNSPNKIEMGYFIQQESGSFKIATVHCMPCCPHFQHEDGGSMAIKPQFQVSLLMLLLTVLETENCSEIHSQKLQRGE